jgi:uncharacterized membrane protein
MDGKALPARIVFAVGMIGLGVLGVVQGDFAMVWQPVAAWVPWREGLAYAAGIVMVLGGVGLLFERTALLSARILFPYLVIWLLLKGPAIVVAPQLEAAWLGFGEIAVLMAGGWVLLATLATQPDVSILRFATGERGMRLARILFALSLLPIGLSHLVYADQTAGLVPVWLPYRIGWAYLTGAGHIAAGLGVLFSIYPRLAATMEAGMLSVFTILVWVPAVVAAPKGRLPWTAFWISWAITAGAWVVAGSISGKNSAARVA